MAHAPDGVLPVITDREDLLDLIGGIDGFIHHFFAFNDKEAVLVTELFLLERAHQFYLRISSHTSTKVAIFFSNRKRIGIFAMPARA